MICDDYVGQTVVNTVGNVSLKIFYDANTGRQVIRFGKTGLFWSVDELQREVVRLSQRVEDLHEILMQKDKRIGRFYEPKKKKKKS